MFSRATSSPAVTSSVIRSGLDVAGPRVHTIFARRLMAGAPSPVAAGGAPRRRPLEPAARNRPVVYTIMAELGRKVTRLTQVSPGVHQPESWAPGWPQR